MRPAPGHRCGLGRLGLAPLALVAAVLPAGCGSGPAQPRDVPIVLYLVDTLRADRLGAWGYDRETSPALDALAEESVVFEQAYAPAPWTLPSVASLLTSTHLCEHGVVVERMKLDPALTTLAERLASVGFRTASFYNNWFVGKIAGLDRGYEVRGHRKILDNVRAPDVQGWLDEVGATPFLLYLHTIEPHDPPIAPERHVARLGAPVSQEERDRYQAARARYGELIEEDWYRKRPRGSLDYSFEIGETLKELGELPYLDTLYDASVLHADENLQAVVEVLKARGVWDEAIFVFLSDHGDEFGERGRWSHQHSVYEELVRVPLLIHFPGGEFGGQRHREAVSLVDVMPTLFDYLGRSELCEGCRGESLLPLLRGEARDPGVVVPAMRIDRRTYYRPWEEQRGSVNVVVREGAWKGIWNVEHDSLELYELELDPAERTDVAAQDPARARRLRDEARAWFEACGAARRTPDSVEELDPESREQLRSLGYLD